MLVLILLINVLPLKETMVYITKDKEKTGQMNVVNVKDSLGYRVRYMSTVYAKKTVGSKVELEAKRTDKYYVFFKGNNYSYSIDTPIYDRHAIEFALRGFDYDDKFEKTIRFHVPEFMVVNAKLKVVGEETLSKQVGVIECWKIEMLIKVLLISWKSYFWIEKAYPHRFVMFEDASGDHSITLSEYTSE
jgi:hypothetical protein